MLAVKPFSPIINWGNPLTDRLVFDTPIFETGGNYLNDIVKKNNMTGTGSPTRAATPFGIGVKGDGSTISLKTASPISSVVDNLSMECWFVADSTAAEEVMFYNGKDNAGYGLEISGGTMQLLIGGIARINTSVTVTTGKVYHFVAVRQSTSWKLYVNGLVTSASGTNSPNTPSTNSQILAELSSDGVTINRWFTGKVMGARLWERPLTPGEVLQLFQNPWSLYQSPTYEPFFSPAATVAARQFLTLLGVGS